MRFWFWRRWGYKRYREKADYYLHVLGPGYEVVAENLAAATTGRLRKNRRNY